MRTQSAQLTMVLLLTCLIFVVSLCAADLSEKSDHAPLKQVADIPLPGPALRFVFISPT